MGAEDEQDEQIRTVLDVAPDDRSDEELMLLQEVLKSRGIFDSLDISEVPPLTHCWLTIGTQVTMLEMLRVMVLLTAEARSFLYHESQINPDLYVLLSGRVTLLCTPPQRSSQDETLTKGTPHSLLPWYWLTIGRYGIWEHECREPSSVG